MSEPVFQLITPERLQNPRADAAIDWNICYLCQKDDTSGDLQFPCNKNEMGFIFKLFSVFVQSMNKEFSGIIYLNREVFNLKQRAYEALHEFLFLFLPFHFCRL